METEQNMGRYWSHSAQTRKLLSEQAKARWAKISKRKREAIGKKISKAKEGVTPRVSKEARLSRAEKVKAHWATMTPRERKARVLRAAKAKRAAAKEQ